MTAIWRNDGGGWRMLAPTGYPEELALHRLVEEAPQMLPLSGGDRLTVVGREVMLGNGYADLIAVESSGQVAVIEVKLARNAEARRAVIAQVLTYAAYLRGLSVEALENRILASHLAQRGYQSLADAVADADQEGSFDRATFSSGLTASLLAGSFRLVIVLDNAPDELSQLVGYLEAVAPGLTIDLITVASYDIGGSQILVPQRVEPERLRAANAVVVTPVKSPQRGVATHGVEQFRAAIDEAPEDSRALLNRLCDWAVELEQAGLARLISFHGVSNVWSLLPHIASDDAGFVTIYNQNGPGLSLHRTVFERRAPESIERIEQIIAPAQLGQGRYAPNITQELLDALTDAYREAASTA